MAKMIPLEIKERDITSSSEVEVFHLLKNGLSDEWLVIYSLRWITDDDIFLGKSNGECDFILLHPNFGIMILEVKGGVISCINGEWSSISINNIKRVIKDPEKQANEAKFNLLSRFKRNGVKPYVTTAIWFPDCIKEKCLLPLSISKEIVLDMASFNNNIEEEIVKIFKYRAEKEAFVINKVLESDFKKIIDILNPKTEIKMPLLRLTNKLNMKFMTLNKEQNLFFEQLDGNKFVSVKGHAGTGKTVLAVKKAFRESEAGKKVLFLCYNALLKESVQNESNDEFDVFTIHSLAIEYLKKFNVEAFEIFEENGDFEDMMNAFVLTAKKNKEKYQWLFDSIIIDEGQDFTQDWFEAVSELLVYDGSSSIFYDENQMLYNKYGRNNISFLEKGTKFTLMRNMRNTDQICRSSLNVIGENEINGRLNGVNGINPDIVFSEDTFDNVNHLKNIIRELKKSEYLTDNNITILTMEAKKKLKYKKSIESEFRGTVESIRRFKGLESDVVIIPDISSNFLADDNLRKLLYVGMSRAKAHVVLIIDTEAMNRKQRVSYKKEIMEKLL